MAEAACREPQAPTSHPAISDKLAAEVQTILFSERQKIKAVRRVREETNLGLREALSYVDTVLKESSKLAHREGSVTPQVDKAVRLLLGQGKRLEAMKWLRAKSRLGIKESMEYVDTLLATSGSAKESAFREMVNDLLLPFAQEIEETFIIATLERRDIIYLHVIESDNPKRVVADVGQRRDATFGATGLALLSCLYVRTRQSFARDPLPKYTAKTITEPKMWLERLEKMAQEGIAIEHGEYEPGVAAVAMPIKSRRPLALTVVGPEERMMPKEKQILGRLPQMAKQLEKIPLPQSVL
jgi:DNA-binding IclR family transcriptional regulator